MNLEPLTSDTPMSAEARLRFLVRFALMDVDALRQGDWLNLGEEVAAFLSRMVFPGGDTTLPPGGFDVRPAFGVITDFPEELHQFQARMHRLQPEVHGVLEAYALDLDASGAPDYTKALQRRSPATPVHVEITHTPFFSSVRGTMEEVWWWHVQRLIMDGPVGKVVHCRECGTIFYRVRQQVHCSRACTNRVSQRRFRARHEAEATSVS